MDRIKIVLLLLGYSLMSILAQLILFCFMLIYSLAAIFWKEETFYRISRQMHDAIKEL